MAALTAAVPIEFDANRPPSLAQKKSSGTLTFFRGSILHAVTATGLLLKAPAAADWYTGVAWEGKATVANDLIFVAITGRFFWANTSFTDANHERSFAMLAAALTDNPADLGLAAVGTAGTVGCLDHVASTAVNGWINTDRRALPENA